MGVLFDKIRRAVEEGRFGFSNHADDMLRERSVTAWQVVAGLAMARLIRERPRAKPNPVAEAEQTLADGTPIKAVWAYVQSADAAKLVTVHFFDG